MSHECLHKRLGGQVGLVLETHCKMELQTPNSILGKAHISSNLNSVKG